MCDLLFLSIFFFFNDTATTEIYTLSLHDALPILLVLRVVASVLDGTFERLLLLLNLFDQRGPGLVVEFVALGVELLDRKSTRLNSSHVRISYAVFCLKKKICSQKSGTSRETAN